MIRVENGDMLKVIPGLVAEREAVAEMRRRHLEEQREQEQASEP